MVILSTWKIKLEPVCNRSCSIRLSLQNLSNIIIEVPTTSDQQTAVSQLENIEKDIRVLEAELADIPNKKGIIVKNINKIHRIFPKSVKIVRF